MALAGGTESAGAPEADEPFDRTLTTYVDEGVAIACSELDGSVGIAVIALDSGEARWDDTLGEQGAFFGLAGGHVIVSDGEGSQIPGCFPYGGPQTSVPTARSLDSGDEVWSLDDDGFVMSLTDRCILHGDAASCQTFGRQVDAAIAQPGTAAEGLNGPIANGVTTPNGLNGEAVHSQFLTKIERVTPHRPDPLRVTKQRTRHRLAGGRGFTPRDRRR